MNLMRLRDASSHRPAPSSSCCTVATATVMLLLCTAAVKPAKASGVLVEPAQARQHIDGFGASSAWTAGKMSDGDVALAFDPNMGAGLSLLRVRMAPDGTCLETDTALKAQALGARVWATPWSPPVQWKTPPPSSPTAAPSVNYGKLDPAHYGDWANAMVAFVQSMAQSGVNLVAISAQNEPNYQDLVTDTYESCAYSSSDLANFIANYLGPALAGANLLSSTTSGIPAAGTGVTIIGPETQDWGGFGIYEPQMQSAGAARYVGIFATHAYGGGSPAAYPSIGTLWQTEVYQQNHTPPGGMPPPPDPGMGNGIWTAQQIHASLVGGGVSAWHQWWIYPGSADNSALWDRPTGMPAKRMWVIGNYARFVRPGFHRVDATNDIDTGVQATAFVDPSMSKIVLVAINSSTAPVSETFGIDHFVTDPAQWQAWVTSDTTDVRSPAANPVTVNPADNEITYSLPAQSVTTLTGIISGPGPAVSLPASPASAGGGTEATASMGPGRPNSGLACSAATASRLPGGDENGWRAFAVAAMIALGAAGARRRRTRG